MMFNLFLKELNKFSRENWWVYIVFLICIIFIYSTDSWNILEVLFITTIHFSWDILMMMMWDYYSRKENKKWSMCQIWTIFIFTFIWAYAWIVNQKWQFLSPQISFIYVWLKALFKDVFQKDFKYIFNKYVFAFITLITIFIYVYFWTVTNYSVFSKHYDL